MKQTEISTVNMSYEDWLMHRKNAIGGSDAATVVGLNPYGSLYELWADKLGLIPPKEENEAMRIGHDLEEYVAKRFTEATGKKVRRKNAIIYNDDVPFAHANVDRLIVGEDAGLECKTTSVLSMKRFKDGEFPPNYYVQCQHYMMVTGKPKWYLAVLILGREFKWFEIARNEEDIEALSTAERDFWQLVESRTEPPVDSSKSCTDTLGAVYDESRPDTIDISAYRTDLIRREKLTAKIKELETERNAIDNEIKAFLGEADTGETNGYKVTWRAQERRTFDTKRFAADNPDIDLTSYYKVSTSRIFKIREEK